MIGLLTRPAGFEDCDPGEYTVVIDGAMDHEGKTPFTVRWFDDTNRRWRGQCFRADLDGYKREWERQFKAYRILGEEPRS